MDRVYGAVTAVYWLIILYFLAMMFWKLMTESKLSMQIAISVAMIPFIYRLLGIK